jgi:predicted enzyme related to lactoylglutathione lyase
VWPVRIRGYAPATPCWVELATSDQARAVAFYGELLDWKADGAGRFLLRDFIVAGLAAPRPGRRTGWLMHLSTDDLDASLDRVIVAGGLLHTPPAVVGPADRPDGRTATIADPGGATFGLWEHGWLGGAQIAGEPGAVCWSELCTGDAIGAAVFYGQAFDWLLRGGPTVGSDRGEWLCAAHDSVAGLAPADPGADAAHWRIVFQVEDCAATVERCLRLGGAVRVGPYRSGAGDYAELVDPQGAAFAVLAPTV